MAVKQITFICAQVLLAIGNWLLVIFLAQEFDLNFNGEYHFALAIISPIFLLSSLQLRNHYLTRNADNQVDFSDYSYLRSVSLVFAAAISCFICWLLDSDWQIFFALCSFKVAEGYFELLLMYFQKENRLERCSLYMFIRSLVHFGGIILLIKFGVHFLESFLYSSLALYLISFLTIIKKINFSKVEFVFLKFLLLETKGIAISAFILGFNLSLGRIALGKLVSKEVVAIYSASFALYSLSQIIINSYYSSQIHHFKSVSISRKLYFPLIGVILGFIAFYFTDDFFYGRFFGEKYIVASSYTVYLFAAILLSVISSYFYYEFISKNHYADHFKINLITLLTNAGLLALLYHFQNGIGVWISWSCALIIQIVLYWNKGRQNAG